MYTNLNRKGWVYVNKNDNRKMPQGKNTQDQQGKKKPGPPKPKNMKKTLKTLISYLGKYKLQLLIVMILIVVNSIAMVAGSYFLKPLVNNYILPGDFSGLAKMLAVLGTIFGLGAIAAYGYARLMVHIAQNTISNIRIIIIMINI